MWSDPDDIDTWSVSPRGAGWLFGAQVTHEVGCLSSTLFHPLTTCSLSRFRQFNHINGISLIARAHQLVQEGYKHMFDDALVTVWSAPNYCYRCGNSASIMEVKEDGKTEFKVYMAAEENDRDPKNEAARRVSSEPT
jgi:serine/threonine-protein phosphatase 6 catalytic subunit